MDNTPFVSVIIPCRNEEKYIAKCLDSIIQQDYPKENLEILVVDGASQDKTKEIVEQLKIKNQSTQINLSARPSSQQVENSGPTSNIQLFDNPKKYTPFGLNIGIKNSKGEIIVRMDAHAGYEKNYISKCVKYLKEYDVDNVGGAMKTLPAKNTTIAKSIALCLSDSFGAASRFRLGADKPMWVDTVFGGCYKREVFEKIGLFNENLIRTQDLEFNLRLKKQGGKILLAPDIVVYYYPKTTFGGFLTHTLVDGFWTTYPLKFINMPLKIRHYLPVFLVLGILGPLVLSLLWKGFLWLFFLSAGSYALLNIYFSFKAAIRERNLKFLFLMPIAFGIRHLAYGLGSVWGLISLLKK